MNRLAILLVLTLVGCLKDDVHFADSGDSSDTGTLEEVGQTTAVVTTVSSDVTTGSFATISLDDWSVSDELFVTSGDGVVSSDDDMVFQINRLGIDTVRMYTPGEWTEPVWEKELADLSNPGPADVCDGKLFIALYGTATLGVYDPSNGNLTGTVDLSSFDDGDGVGPEPGSLVEVGGKLYVGMNRLDRANGWVDAGGAVAEVDCGTMAVTNQWAVGGNTTVHAWPGSEQLLVLARAFGGDVGGLYSLDPSGAPEWVASVVGEEFSGVAANGEHAVAISLASDYSHYAHHCIDLTTGEVTSSTNTAAYYSAISGNDRGEAWVVASPSWIDGAAPTGITVFDIETCEERTAAPIALSLSPKDISFF